MELKLNRRTFLLAVGTTSTAVALCEPRVKAPCKTNGMRRQIGTLHFFTPDCPEPTARPRTTAIHYLSLL